jgi:hypothetical protein
MRDLGRGIYNTIFRSAHRFNDGSGLYHMIRYGIVRYYSGDRVRRIADIPIIYDPAKRLSRIDSQAIWRWRDPRIPLGDWSDSGPELSEAEKLDLYQKLRVFMAKQPNALNPCDSPKNNCPIPFTFVYNKSCLHLVTCFQIQN